MKEYIEREAAIKEIAKWLADVFGIKSESGAGTLFKKLRSIPAADVVEVQHGENIGEDYDAVDQFVCSKCGIELQGWYMVERDMDDGEETHHEYVMRYCPNCGAKMDGGADK